MAQEYMLGLDTLCNTVLGVNENIQSVSVINRSGRSIQKITRDDADLPIQDQQKEMLLMQCALTISMERDFDESLGEVGYIHVERKNLSMFSFPLGDHIVLVTSKTAIGPIALAKKIASTIKKYRRILP